MKTADFVGILSSKVLCQQFAKAVKFLPAKSNKYTSYDTLDKTLVYPVPKDIKFRITVDAQRCVQQGTGVCTWFYKVELLDGGYNFMRYSVLKGYHKRLKESVKRASKEIATTNLISLEKKFPKFPTKFKFRQNMNKEQATLRAKELENYFNYLVSYNEGNILKFPEIKLFICNLCVSSLIN